MTIPFTPQRQRLNHVSIEKPFPKSSFSRSWYATNRFVVS
jgi:hypothetical protein